MSTAGRPTFAQAVGSDRSTAGGYKVHAPSTMVSAKDVPGFTTLKVRKDGQNTESELRKRDLRGELEEREAKHFKKDHPSSSSMSTPVIRQEPRKAIEQKSIFDLDKDDDDEEEQSRKVQSTTTTTTSSRNNNNDSDNENNNNNNDNENNNNDDEDDDEDDTAELMRELERIKKEKEEEQIRKIEQERKAEEEAALKSNPLVDPNKPKQSQQPITQQDDFNMKKKWYDDTVFKNQHKVIKEEKRFINDTIRNDFHKKFLDKFLK